MIDRYSPCLIEECDYDPCADMERDERGDWVRYEDVQRAIELLRKVVDDDDKQGIVLTSTRRACREWLGLSVK